MSKTADKTYLQNENVKCRKRITGVQSLRAQADKKRILVICKKLFKEQENLDLIEGMVEDLVIEDETVKRELILN